MKLILDAGALIALDRGNRATWRRLKRAQERGTTCTTHGGVLAQVWRGGSRQTNLARALPGIEVLPLDEELGHAAGELLGRNGTSDVIDAALVLLADDGDDIATSDIRDLAGLARTAGRHIELIAV